MNLSDLSLLLGLLSLTLIALAGLLSPYYGKINMLIDNKRLENSVILVVIAFVVVVTIRIVYV